MAAHITFHGGAGTVTGANIRVEVDNASFLMDCGIEQRDQICDPSNYAPFSYDPKHIETLIVTHAHQDHIGRIPRLVRDGFHGTIYSTSATKDLSALMFEDALSIMAREAEKPCGDLYDAGDVKETLKLWKGIDYHTPFSIPGNVRVTFLDAGHILGSAMVSCEHGGKKLLFSGDVGNSPEPLLPDTEAITGAHYAVVESVYGDRVHEGKHERRSRLKEVIEAVRAKRGVLLIPSFSIERTQILLHELDVLIENKDIAPIPVYLDAPLAIRVTDVYKKHRHLFNAVIRNLYEEGDDPFSFQGLTLTMERKESDAIHRSPDPKIIIAGAGMSHGGRIREHEQRYLRDKRATILFVGYQSPGSLGRRIMEGQKLVEIDGEKVRVNASVETILSYSGHKDRDGLLSLIESAGQSLVRVFVVFGEPRSSMFLAQRVHGFLSIDAVVPESGAAFDLDW